MKLNRTAVVYMICGALLALMFASVLPVWTIWHSIPMEGLGYPLPLWCVIFEMCRRGGTANSNPDFPVTVYINMDDSGRCGVDYRGVPRLCRVSGRGMEVSKQESQFARKQCHHAMSAAQHSAPITINPQERPTATNSSQACSAKSHET